jgi:hypothetical protein
MSMVRGIECFDVAFFLYSTTGGGYIGFSVCRLGF